jgi:hypothetical protein
MLLGRARSNATPRPFLPCVDAQRASTSLNASQDVLCEVRLRWLEWSPDDMTRVHAFGWADAVAPETLCVPPPNHSDMTTYQRPYDLIESAGAPFLAQHSSQTTVIGVAATSPATGRGGLPP